MHHQSTMEKIVCCLCFSILLYLMKPVTADCGNFTACSWAKWFDWSKCSNLCGQGVRERYQGVCCRNLSAHIPYNDCIKDCNLTASDGHQSGVPCTDYTGCPTSNHGSRRTPFRSSLVFTKSSHHSQRPAPIIKPSARKQGKEGNSSSDTVPIAVGAVFGSLLVIGLAFLLAFLLCRWKKNSNTKVQVQSAPNDKPDDG